MVKVKKLLAGVAACTVAVSVFAASSSVLAATPLAGTTHKVGKATVAPTIDGNLNDEVWITGTPFEVSNDYKDTDPSGNARTWPGFKYKWAWDSNNLYLAVDMTDHSLYCNTTKLFKGDDGAGADARDPWDYTNLQWRFSPTDNKGNINDLDDANYVNGDAQYVITYQDDGKPCFRVGAWSQNDQLTRFASGVMKSAKLACTKTDHGWDLECAFPWSSIAVTNAAAGSPFSFRLFQQVIINGGQDNEDGDVTPSVNDVISDDGYTVNPDGNYSSVTWSKFQPWVDQLLLTNDPADAGASSSAPSSSSSTPVSSSTPATSSSTPAASSSTPAASSSTPAASSSTPAVSSSAPAASSSTSVSSSASSASSASSVSADSSAGAGTTGSYSTPDYSAGSSAAATTAKGSGETANVNTGSTGNAVAASVFAALIAGATLVVLKKKK